MTNTKHLTNSISPYFKTIVIAFLLLSFFSVNAQPSWEDGDDVDDEYTPPVPIEGALPLLVAAGSLLGYYFIVKRKTQQQ